MDDSHGADTWNGFYEILSGMKRAEKTCFIHCAKFIVSFILLEFHKFLSVTWSMSICKSNLMLHWLNKDVTIFYAHQRLLRCQAQDILTGPVRLVEIQTCDWRPKLCHSQRVGLWVKWQLRCTPWPGSLLLLLEISILKSIMATTQEHFLKAENIASFLIFNRSIFDE